MKTAMLALMVLACGGCQGLADALTIKDGTPNQIIGQEQSDIFCSGSVPGMTTREVGFDIPEVHNLCDTSANTFDTWRTNCSFEFQPQVSSGQPASQPWGLEHTCTMNGYGVGSCRFTNTTDEPLASCGRIVVTRRLNSKGQRESPKPFGLE